MNIVRSTRLGQFPGEGIASDITLGPQDTTDNFPMYYDPGLLIAEQGAPPSAPAPAVSVPQPPSGFLPADAGGWGSVGTTYAPATAQTPAPGAISPAPHVTIPTSTVSGFMSSSLAGIPMVAWLGIGLVGILALSSGGGRRRR
jgi:hypothetical protein